MNTIHNIFQGNITTYQSEYAKLNKQDKTLSALRIILFLLSLSIIVYGANDRNGLLVTLTVALFFVLFGILISFNNRIKFKKQTSFYLKTLNEDELQRANGDFTKLEKGDEYFDKNHPYAPDLDIFGSNSLFQLIIRSRLLQTKNLAADWMLNLSDKAAISERQSAIKELSKNLEWRQLFTSYGMHAEDAQLSNQQKSFAHWMIDENQFIEKAIWKVINWLMPIISLGAIIGIVFFEIPYQVIFIPIVINAFILKVTFEPLLKLTEDFDKASKSLKMYEYSFTAIEQTKFDSEKLQALKAQVCDGKTTASKAIRSLKNILNQLQNRGNMLYQPINVLFLLDLFWLRQTEIWKKKHGKSAEKWFAAVHEFDLLSDMASFSYANPDYTFPTLTQEAFVIKAEELGHPLIKEHSRVSNSFGFAGKGFVGLITGSNMSGKSTFLRTVGLNLAMAQMGLPVCAKSFTFSATRIFTGMRTTDNLEESVSSFYAELARIKSLLDSINNEEPVFYLLDEILKGTNSEDRNKGSISLIQQLNNKTAFGLISTHDLTLSSMENDSKSIKNYSFNSTIEGDEIIFDYRLTDGACRSFNASKLMEKMGIIV